MRHLWTVFKRSFSGMHLRDFMPRVQPDAHSMIPTALPPYLQHSENTKRRVVVETFGCQMNVNDTDIVRGILTASNEYSCENALNENSPPDVMLLMTCAIREGAEAKIWARIDALAAVARKARSQMTIGVLGCMATRLKEEVLERKRTVDIVCGPDAYRDLPRLLQSARAGTAAINTMLSADETYADIAPVRVNLEQRTAFVSIMRGCNNMCAFCIVPHVRGRERSRPLSSIVDEVRRLVDSEGVREVTLLGQNVNSYRDTSLSENVESEDIQKLTMSRGFSTVYRFKSGSYRGSFVHLLDEVSKVSSQLRIRFTSPHPKDFPDELLELMRDRPNICKQIHLPAQSGSTSVLERMRRGYTSETYLSLVDRIRESLPNVHLSSDFIAGFCGETDAEHQNTIELIRRVGYDMAYMFAYSMREKTMAHRRYVDDVPQEIKAMRLDEIVRTFYASLSERVHRSVGQEEVLLVEGQSKKSEDELSGRSDGGRKVVFPRTLLADGPIIREPVAGDYVKVLITSVRGTTPLAKPMAFTRI